MHEDWAPPTVLPYTGSSNYKKNIFQLRCTIHWQWTITLCPTMEMQEFMHTIVHSGLPRINVTLSIQYFLKYFKIIVQFLNGVIGASHHNCLNVRRLQYFVCYQSLLLSCNGIPSIGSYHNTYTSSNVIVASPIRKWKMGTSLHQHCTTMVIKCTSLYRYMVSHLNTPTNP